MHLSEIWIYPVKSLGGMRVNESLVGEEGLQYDRRWMVVDETGKFLTQRLHPAMALIEASIVGTELILSDQNNRQNQIHIPFDFSVDADTQVQVWKDIVQAKSVGGEVDGWLSHKLGKNVRLMMMTGKTQRKMDPNDFSRSTSLSFADDFPYLLTNEASLSDLNSRLEHPVKMNRFRPNFLITGAEPFAEDRWQTIRIGDTSFAVAKPCERCILINVNQHTAERGSEPLKTLASYRKENRKIIFGQNLVALNHGLISQGDAVEIIHPSLNGL